MRITLSEIRRLIIEAGYMPKPKSGQTAKKVANLGIAAGTPIRSEDIDELERKVRELSKFMGGKSFTGTRQMQISSPHITRITSVSDGNRIKRDWVIPYKGPEQAVAILIANNATDVGGTDPKERLPGGAMVFFPRSVLESLGRIFYVRGTNRLEYIQIVYASPDDQYKIATELAEAMLDTDKKRKYLELAIHILTAGDSETIEHPTAVERGPTLADIQGTPQRVPPKPKAAPPAKGGKAAKPVSTTVDGPKVANAYNTIKSRTRTVNDVKYYIGLVARAANGKIGSDAALLKPVLGHNFKDVWNPTELTALKDQLIAYTENKK